MATTNDINNVIGPVMYGFCFFAATNNAIVNGALTTVLYQATPLWDKDANFNYATGTYTVASPGLYTYDLQLVGNAVASCVYRAVIVVERSSSAVYRSYNEIISGTAPTFYTPIVRLTSVVPLNSGDKVYSQILMGSGTGTKTLNASISNFWTLYKFGDIA